MQSWSAAPPHILIFLIKIARTSDRVDDAVLPCPPTMRDSLTGCSYNFWIIKHPYIIMIGGGGCCGSEGYNKIVYVPAANQDLDHASRATSVCLSDQHTHGACLQVCRPADWCISSPFPPTCCTTARTRLEPKNTNSGNGMTRNDEEHEQIVYRDAP